MGLTNELVGPKMLAKIKIYDLTRAELLFNLCYEIPCTQLKNTQTNMRFRLIWVHITHSPNYWQQTILIPWFLYLNPI